MSADGNRYLLVVVVRASKFLFGYCLASKGSLEVSQDLMALMLTFGVPQSIKSDGGGEFSAQVVGHLCRWMNVALNHGAADFAGAKGLRSGWEGSFRSSCRYRARNGRCGGMNMCSPLAGSSG